MLVPVTGVRRVAYILAIGCSIVGASAGCIGHRGPEADPKPEPPAPTPLTVTNGSFLDYAVYLDHDGEVSRVATVTAASQALFLIPQWMMHSRLIRLSAHGIGSVGAIRTEFIYVQPGQRIEWRLESNPTTSTVAVY